MKKKIPAHRFLIQILIPVSSTSGRTASVRHQETKKELTERFGGLTCYSRSPAEGVWKKRSSAADRDDIVVYEVMASRLDRTWWKHYRDRLEKRFEQEELVVRGQPMERM